MAVDVVVVVEAAVVDVVAERRRQRGQQLNVTGDLGHGLARAVREGVCMCKKDDRKIR